MKVGKFRHEVTFSLVRRAEPSKGAWCAEEVKVEEKGCLTFRTGSCLVGAQREAAKEIVYLKEIVFSH
jgi:hypothetical protein